MILKYLKTSNPNIIINHNTNETKKSYQKKIKINKNKNNEI